jgi:hypothetical protein
VANEAMTCCPEILILVGCQRLHGCFNHFGSNLRKFTPPIHWRYFILR